MKKRDGLFKSKDNKHYPIYITKKPRMKNIIFRYRDEAFIISAPPYVSNEVIFKRLKLVGPRLLAKQNSTQPITSDYYYLFGEKMSRNDLSEVQLEKYLKEQLSTYLAEQVPLYEAKLGIPRPYKIRIKKMTSRYASNSKKTHSLSFSLKLVHYDKQIIDAIIIHELIHYFISGHQSDFYKKLDKYCPNYDQLINQLKQGEFSYDGT